MRRPAWVGPEIDLQKPSPARVCDELVEPGVVYLPEWRPEPGEDVADASTTSTFAGVGRKA